MNLLQNDSTDRSKSKAIHISDLSYNPCNRFLYFLYSGKFKQEFNQQTLWHFAVGKVLHTIIQENYKRECKGEVFIEQKLEYKSITGRADMIEVGEKFIDIDDIKSTNSFLFEKEPTVAMEKQVSIYAGIVGSTDIVKIPKGAKIRCWIWKVNKGGLPRYFDFEQDRYPITLDIYKELDEAVERADLILKCRKDKVLPEGNKKGCQYCPAKALCIVEGNAEKEKKLYGGKK